MLRELEGLEAFRIEVREWLGHSLPADWRDKMRGASEEEHIAFQRWWFGKLMEAGYGAPHWPTEWGGSGFSFARQIVLYEETYFFPTSPTSETSTKNRGPTSETTNLTCFSE